MGFAGLLRELGLRLGYAEFFWVSSPEATHSRNITVRPQVGIAIFNSQAPIGTGQGVYMTAEAEEVTGADLARGIEVFSRRSLAHGGMAWTAEDVGGTTGIRLYRARADGHSILAKDGQPDHRIPADPESVDLTSQNANRPPQVQGPTIHL